MLTTVVADGVIIERRATGRTATTVLGRESVDYYVTDAAGQLEWSLSIPNGPRAQRRRELADREQRYILERPERAQP